MKDRDYQLKRVIQLAGLHYSKPRNMSYYQYAINKFLSPCTSDEHLCIIARALMKYHNIDKLHIKFALFMKVFLQYYGTNVCGTIFHKYMLRYEPYVIID